MSQPPTQEPHVNDPGTRRHPGRIWAVAIGAVVVAGLAMASFGSFAGAADDTSGSDALGTSADGTARPPRPQLTDEQRQCLAAQGVTLPAKPVDGTRPAPPTEAQRAAFR